MTNKNNKERDEKKQTGRNNGVSKRETDTPVAEMHSDEDEPDVKTRLNKNSRKSIISRNAERKREMESYPVKSNLNQKNSEERNSSDNYEQEQLIRDRQFEHQNQEYLNNNDPGAYNKGQGNYYQGFSNQRQGQGSYQGYADQRIPNQEEGQGFRTEQNYLRDNYQSRQGMRRGNGSHRSYGSRQVPYSSYGPFNQGYGQVTPNFGPSWQGNDDLGYANDYNQEYPNKSRGGYTSYNQGFYDQDSYYQNREPQDFNRGNFRGLRGTGSYERNYNQRNDEYFRNPDNERDYRREDNENHMDQGYEDRGFGAENRYSESQRYGNRDRGYRSQRGGSFGSEYEMNDEFRDGDSFEDQYGRRDYGEDNVRSYGYDNYYREPESRNFRSDRSRRYGDHGFSQNGQVGRRRRRRSY